MHHRGQFGLGWLKAILRENHWELQKVLVIILSVMSLGIAALRTTLVFEKRRDALVANAKAQREEMQRARLERIREAVRMREEEKAAKRKAGLLMPPSFGETETETTDDEG